MSWRRRAYRGRQREYRGDCNPGYGYRVIVAEKPKAADKIARALGRARKCRYRGVPYWIVLVNGQRVVVASSAGHLFGPYTSERGFPVYRFEWRPLWEFDKGAQYLKKFYDVLATLLPRASLYINACDYDIEGSLIGYMIIEAFGDPRRAYRMKFSSLSPVELRAAYSKLQPLDIEMVEAGRTRHEMDWLWGINISRALMHAVRVMTGKRIILSAGRVQTPTLVEAARRWKERNLAVPLPNYSLSITLEARGARFQAVPEGWKPETRRDALETARRLRGEGKLRVVSSETSRTSVRPPPAFNLGDLQAEAARLYKYGPLKTQKLAEDLYLEGLISYPRTNSQKLPPTIDYKRIIHSLTRAPMGLGDAARRLLAEAGPTLKPVQGRKDDPAHPAIHPTGEIPGELDREHWRIYDLVVRRFLAAFSKPAIVSRTTLILADSKGLRYSSRGIIVSLEGWYFYYPYLRPKEARVPPLPVGADARIVEVKVKSQWTARVPPLSKTELLKWMEAENIGTEATRARIIEILFKRGYLEQRGGKTVVTDLGLMVSDIVEELFPDLSTPELTRKFEAVLDAIREGRATRAKAIEETISVIDKLLEAYREKITVVGERLALALGLREPEVKCLLCSRQAEALDPYPLCRYHREALKRLTSSLPEIARRLDTSEEEALRRIASRRGEAGRWIVEVANLLLSSNEKG